MAVLGGWLKWEGEAEEGLLPSVVLRLDDLSEVRDHEAIGLPAPRAAVHIVAKCEHHAEHRSQPERGRQLGARTREIGERRRELRDLLIE